MHIICMYNMLVQARGYSIYKYYVNNLSLQNFKITCFNSKKDFKLRFKLFFFLGL